MSETFDDTIQVVLSRFKYDTFQNTTETIHSKSETGGESIQAKMTRFKRPGMYNYMQEWYALPKITQGNKETKISRCFNITLSYTTYNKKINNF